MQGDSENPSLILKGVLSMTNTTMTRAEAIENFVRDLSDDDLVTVLHYINGYDGAFEESEYYPMDEFDELMAWKSPLSSVPSTMGTLTLTTITSNSTPTGTSTPANGTTS